jgi:hypothetical protein
MTNKRQTLKSGENSENYQAARDITINQGVSYQEVKEISMDIFQKNFYDLGDKVNNIVKERAEKVINDYVKELSKYEEDALKKTIDPDIRSNLYEAQKNYAKRGDDGIEQLLISMLVERTMNNNDDFKNIILNQSLDIVSKLTNTQIDLLTLIFVLFYGISPLERFEELLRPVEYLLDLNYSSSLKKDLEYLSSDGCTRISIGVRDIKNILVAKRFIELGDEDEFDSNVKNFPLLLKVIEVWNLDHLALANSSILPIGKAIAITNLNKKISLNELIHFQMIEYKSFI